ncbi:hypothetical protein Tco_1470763, partial [Tanacetum coccineum]
DMEGLWDELARLDLGREVWRVFVVSQLTRGRKEVMWPLRGQDTQNRLLYDMRDPRDAFLFLIQKTSKKNLDVLKVHDKNMDLLKVPRKNLEALKVPQKNLEALKVLTRS